MSLTSPDFISADEAFARIQGLTGSNATIQGVVDVINRINPFAPNATSTIGYAGGLNGTPMYEIVKSYARSHPEAAIIDNTAIYDLLNREAFQVELQRIINEVNATNPNPATRLTFSEVYEGKNASGIRVNNTGMWDIGSSHFMEYAVGDVKIFAPFGDTNSVLYSTEVPKLFNTPGVTSINGVPIDIIKTAWNAGNTELAINTIKASSIGEIGTLSAAETGILDGAAMLGHDSRYFGLMHDIIGSNVGAVFSSPIIQKLGAAGLFIDFSISSYNAIEKYNAGDTAGAIHIMEEWGAKTSGIIGGGIIGMAGAQSLTAGILYGIAATTGIVIAPGAIITAFVVAATVAGAYYGADAGKWLLDKGIELELYTQKMIDDFVHDARAWWAEVEKSGGLSEYISDAYWKFLDSIAKSLIDPLIIDLNGNGIALDSWQTSNALFDLNGNGTKENTGWTKANGDDAFLVIDKNSNGKIDDITEMFGNANIPGFAELKKYDSNGDGVINSADSQFNLLRLWNDKNANGTVDAGELTTLAANGVTEISLNKYTHNTLIAGNVENAISTVTINGATRYIHELSFAFENNGNPTANPDLRLPASFQVNIAALMLPYSRGYGSLYSWQAAMTLDATLLAMAQDLAATTPDNFYQIGDKFEHFLFRWAGVENVTDADVYDTGFAHLQFDARKVAFMEKITGGDFHNRTTTGIPLAQQAWDMFYNYFLSKFLVQSVLHDIFPNASYDFATDSLTIGSTLDEVIAGIKAMAPEIGASNFTNYTYFAENILSLNKDQFNDASFDTKLQSLTNSVAGLVEIPGFTFDGRFNYGGSEADILFGTAKNDILHGEGGNDELYGYAASKIIEKYSYFSAVANDNCVDGLFLYVKIA